MNTIGTMLAEIHGVKCKGLIFKSYIYSFASKNYIAHNIKLVIAKRKSCPGCEKCGWILEQYSEALGNDVEVPIVNLDIVRNNRFYRLGTCNEKTDFETGYVDYFDFKLTEVDGV